MVAMVFIVLLMVISILAYLITPDSTPFANQQFLELMTKKPGFKVQMLKVHKNEPVQQSWFIKKMLFGKKNRYTYIPINTYFFRNDSIIVEGYTGVPNEKGEITAYHLADVVYALPAEKQTIAVQNNKLHFTDIDGNLKTADISTLQTEIVDKLIVSKKFYLGTDRFGRDVLSQIIVGSRVSLSVGFISVFISLLIGIFLGSLAGYFRGRVYNVVMWIIIVI
jgi:peptide/nickel transport system permease protein